MTPEEEPVRFPADVETAPLPQAFSLPDRLAPEREAQAMPDGRPAAGDPVVHVTIGRIDVRATPAPQTTPRRTPDRRTAMSLAEYLQKRDSDR
jgi:hypothetical protein